MKKEIDPQATKRSNAFAAWMKSPMPMVTLVKTFDVTHLVQRSRRTGLKFNMLLCWCIGKAASQVAEFYMVPEGNKLMQYDRLAINVIVTTKDGGISMCDVPFSTDLQQFNADYLQLTTRVSESGQPYDLSADCAIIGTSALPDCEIDGIVNQYSGIYNNPFLAWGKYRRRLFRFKLPISLQFHHVQMDGSHATRFLNLLQEVING